MPGTPVIKVEREGSVDYINLDKVGSIEIVYEKGEDGKDVASKVLLHYEADYVEEYGPAAAPDFQKIIEGYMAPVATIKA